MGNWLQDPFASRENQGSPKLAGRTGQARSASEGVWYAAGVKPKTIKAHLSSKNKTRDWQYDIDCIVKHDKVGAFFG
jgi:hypothetical protein